MTSAARPAALLSPGQRRALGDAGYLHLPGFLAQTWLDEVEALVRTGVAEGRLEGPADGGGLYALQQLSEQVPELRPYFWRGPVVDLARELLGPSLRLISNRCVVKPPRYRDIFPWHRDSDEYAGVRADDGITAWIPLQSVDRENGCLWYVAGSHRDAGEPAAPAAPVCLPMQRGDLALHSMGALHMSGSNRTDAARAVVALEYIRADARHPGTGLPFDHAVLLEP